LLILLGVAVIVIGLLVPIVGVEVFIVVESTFVPIVGVDDPFVVGIVFPILPFESVPSGTIVGVMVPFAVLLWISFEAVATFELPGICKKDRCR